MCCYLWLCPPHIFHIWTVVSFTPIMISQDNYHLKNYYLLLFLYFFLSISQCEDFSFKLHILLPPCFWLIISRFSYIHPASQQETKEINSWLLYTPPITIFFLKEISAKHSPIKEVFANARNNVVQQNLPLSLLHFLMHSLLLLESCDICIIIHSTISILLL